MPTDQLTEIFVEPRDLPGFRVSNLGRVQSSRVRGNSSLRTNWHNLKLWLRHRKELHPSKRYLFATMSLGGGKRVDRAVHRLVLEAFVGPCPEGMECRHLDGDQRNNRLDNVVWGTHQENVDDMKSQGRMPRGETNGRAKLNERIVRLIRRLAAEGLSQKYIGDELGIPKSTVGFITSGRSWKHVA